MRALPACRRLAPATAPPSPPTASSVPVLSQMLDTVQADLDSLSSCCERMGVSLAGSRSAAADLLHDHDKLQRALQVGGGCLLALQLLAGCICFDWCMASAFLQTWPVGLRGL